MRIETWSHGRVARATSVQRQSGGVAVELEVGQGLLRAALALHLSELAELGLGVLFGAGLGVAAPGADGIFAVGGGGVGDVALVGPGELGVVLAVEQAQVP